MKKITELTPQEAKKFFLKNSSYFNADFPSYISFEPILTAADISISGADYLSVRQNDPAKLEGVNYSLIANKDGRMAWRPLELMHPAIYISLVNAICSEENWVKITHRFNEFGKNNFVSCCSLPVVSEDEDKDQAAQIMEWWQTVEQASLINSLDYSHILHTDVTDCYGSLYTHSIPWALHGVDVSKQDFSDSLLGNKIDRHIRAGRYGQTNGISQGSVLMDLIAELVLGYVDEIISNKINDLNDAKIIRYRDDYRIFTNSDKDSEFLLGFVDKGYP